MADAYQPIIRGIQAVGQVKVLYRYNLTDDRTQFYMPVPTNLIQILNDKSSNPVKKIPMGTSGVEVSGFRLDSNFLNAAQQIASSAVIPILGGGGVALTNNNRTGSITFTCAKVSTPVHGKQGAGDVGKNPAGRMFGGESQGIGIRDKRIAYDMVTLAQIQQAQPGGDSVGSNILIGYEFCGKKTQLVFEACTIADVAPLTMSGNDAATYNITINYLNWSMKHNVNTFAM